MLCGCLIVLMNLYDRLENNGNVTTPIWYEPQEETRNKKITDEERGQQMNEMAFNKMGEIVEAVFVKVEQYFQKENNTLYPVLRYDYELHWWTNGWTERDISENEPHIGIVTQCSIDRLPMLKSIERGSLQSLFFVSLSKENAVLKLCRECKCGIIFINGTEHKWDKSVFARVFRFIIRDTFISTNEKEAIQCGTGISPDQTKVVYE
ncbi:hypothetical protein RFI_17786 [Reticulomyxa filosa]|uniref:Uncharacterized protein n=1 Tax=Reticulomyxa filosa TaxID=46433 RepID=X6N0N2_RETFI|nr:hypothetical protein RFI_17786 [Reticulomyxa filosa]|eukprot:ETO19443.1 hypothetical protein RFI_17786 [Reticulomyxa filosa]